MSGQIELNDLTVFLTLPTVVLRDQQLPIMVPPPILSAIENSLQGAQLTVDTTDPIMLRLLELIEDFPQQFKTHLSELADPFQSSVGMYVWRGKAVLKADNTASFKGEIRRPTGDDYIAYSELMANLDAEAREETLAHARQCPTCATRLGVKLAEGTVSPEALAACNFGGGETGQA